MSPFLKPEKCNHHFPELNKRAVTLRLVLGFFTTKRLAVVMASLVFIVAWAYTMQINVSATQGYQIKDLNSQVEELKETNIKLNLKYIELQAMANIINSVEGLNLVAIDRMEIINPADSSVALR